MRHERPIQSPDHVTAQGMQIPLGGKGHATRFTGFLVFGEAGYSAGGPQGPWDWPIFPKLIPDASRRNINPK